LLFHVEDILGLAQIKAGKFQKIINRINIRKTLEEVSSIFHQKKSDLGIVV
jgi:hypothetical protein